MLIEEIQRELPGVQIPPFDPRRHGDRYRSQPKAYRRILNALYRANGVMEFSVLASQADVSPFALHALQQSALAYALPSAEKPERVVLPLELLFATPLAENEPNKLVEGLKLYPRQVLWSIAAARKIPADGADEYTMRARLFRRATAAPPLEGLRRRSREILALLQQRGWEIEASHLLRGFGWGNGPSIEGLFSCPNPIPDGLADLLHRMLVIPVRSSPGGTDFQRLGVARELRGAVQQCLGSKESVAADPTCRAGRTPQLESLEGRLRGDLMRFLLLVEQDPPGVTQKRTVNRNDLKRIARRGGIDERRIDYLTATAVKLGLVRVEGGRVVPSAESDELLSTDAPGFPRAVVSHFSRRFPIPALGSWVGEDAARTIGEIARAELHRTLSALDSIVCVHCVAESAARSKKLDPLFRKDDRSRAQCVQEFVEQLARVYYEFGFAAAEIEDSMVRAFRWTPTGVAALGDGDAPAAVRCEAPAVVVQPSGEIIAPCELPFGDLRALARAAEVRSVDAVAVFALNRRSLLGAAQRGEEIGRLKAWLVERSRDPLPQAVAFLLDELAARVGEIEIVPCAAAVKVRDPLILKMMEQELLPVSDGVAALPAGRDPAEFAELLRKKGFLPRLAPGPAAPKAARAPLAAVNSGKSPADAHSDVSCDCYQEARDPEGITERLMHSLDQQEFVEIEIRGGRRETIAVDDVTDGQVAGYNPDTDREVVVSLASITSARVDSDSSY